MAWRRRWIGEQQDHGMREKKSSRLMRRGKRRCCPQQKQARQGCIFFEDYDAAPTMRVCVKRKQGVRGSGRVGVAGVCE